MKPMLVIKTQNGYAVMEYSGDIPQTDIHAMHVATHIGDSSWHRRGESVESVLTAHFEPPQPMAEAA